MIHKKKKKKEGKFRLFRPYSKPISAYFGMFQPFSACFDRIGQRPIQPNMADTAQFWLNQPGSAQIKADLTRIESRQRESSRVNANPRKKKKKKNADADQRAGNHVGCRILRWAASDTGAAPLVLRPCFLVLLQEDYI